MKKKQLQFQCRKCNHQLFVDEKPGWVKKITNDNEDSGCPNCGEENEENWILIGYGNYEDFIK